MKRNPELAAFIHAIKFLRSSNYFIGEPTLNHSLLRLGRDVAKVEFTLNLHAENKNPVSRDNLEAINLIVATMSLANTGFATVAKLLSELSTFKPIVDYVREHMQEVQRRIVHRRFLLRA